MSTPQTEQDRLDRLPKWAQQRIARLERDLADAHAHLSCGPAESDTFADPYSEAVRPLGLGPTIEFVLSRRSDGSSKDYIQARLEDCGRVYVHGSDGLGFFPSASNTGYIKLGRP